MITSVEKVVGTVRFVVLFALYVAALTAMGVARAGQALYRGTVGRVLGSGPKTPTGEAACADAGQHATTDGDPIEEPPSL